MSIRAIKILHVEDEDAQRLLIAHHLKAIEDCRFEIYYADAEKAALDLFRSGEMEFVILDYNLRQGNGLHCLEKIRQLDPIVPIIAISGQATQEIAAELVQAGADDYINKQELDSSLLAESLKTALVRADTWRKRNMQARP
jgi:two-component system cell cycle response regulator